MAQLFGDVGLVGRPVETVPAPAEFPDVVIFGRELGVRAGFVISPETDRLRAELRRLRKAVAVAVVMLPVAHHAEQVNPGPVVVRNESPVEGGVDVVPFSVQKGGDVGNGQGVPNRLLGDDVHHAPDSVGPEQGRSAAPDHLRPFDHPGGKLFQPVNGSERTENRTAVNNKDA